MNLHSQIYDLNEKYDRQKYDVTFKYIYFQVLKTYLCKLTIKDDGIGWKS